MDAKKRLKNVVYYLMNIKNLKRIINIRDYEKIFWEKNILKNGGEVRFDENNNKYIEVKKDNKNLYNQINRLNIKLKKNYGKLELIWGCCFFVWKINGREICHPLFTCKVKIILNEKNESFIIKILKEKINFEVDILGYEQFSNLESVLDLKKKVKENNFDLENKDSIKENVDLLIKEVTSKKANKGFIRKSTINISDFSITKHPVFYNENVIILRDTSFVKWNVEFENILDRIEYNKNIPLSVQALVDDKKLGDDKEKDNDLKEKVYKNLYPMPYNHNQFDILQNLIKNFGIVVDGPSGSGKTYGIANLICNLIANKKRVLVTGELFKSIEIVLDKIPESIKSFCLSIGYNENENLQNIKKISENITNNLNLDIKKFRKKLDDLNDELSLNRTNQQYALNKLNGDEVLKDESIKFRGKMYKVSNIMDWIKNNKEQYSWIEDDIPLNNKPLITDAKFSRLVYLISTINKKEIDEFNLVYGVVYGIPSFDEFIPKIKRVVQLENEYEKYKSVIYDWCVSYNVDYDYEYIVNLLDKCRKILCDIKSDWTFNILKCSKKGNIVKNVLQQVLLECNYYIKKLGSISIKLGGRKIEVPNNFKRSTLLENFNIICNEYKHKKKLGKIFKVFHCESMNILKNCYIDSKSIETREQVDMVKLYIEKSEIEENLKNTWNNSMKEYGFKEINDLDMNKLSQIEGYIDKINIIINWEKLIKNKVNDAMKKILFLNERDWYSEDTYLNLKEGILSIKYISEYENLKSDVSNTSKLISNIQGFYGISEAINKRNIKKLEKIYKKIDRLKGIGPYVKELDYLMEGLKDSCPKLVENLLNETDKLNMLSKYKNFSKAWLLKQFKILLEKEKDKYVPENIKKYISAKKDKEKQLVNNIIYNEILYNILINVKEKEKRSFYALIEFIKRLENSTGKYTIDYMNLIKKEINKIKNILPVWFMPVDKAIENFNVYEKKFDVVIIDEGNNNSIFSLPALFRGEKSVIVGNEQEYNVNFGGIDESKVNDLMKRYINEVPNFQLFNMRTSIYSTALRIFPNKIKLNEQFRCIKENIFLNDKIYSQNQVISLLNYNIDEKFNNLIKDIKVDGKRDKNKPINIIEANKIVDKISDCCKDPKYKGMTIGVISLLGEFQDEVIKTLLKEKIGEKQMRNRKILCGTPCSFKGEERDIVFLSMVISKNVKFKALTSDVDIKKYNIAITRGKKQVWLFHSVDLEDLNQDCIRYRLIKYFKNNSKNNMVEVKVIA